MDNKLSTHHIAEILSEKTGITAAEVEKFLKEFAFIVNEGITNDNIVKVKGIGTFKVVLVKERESVHVNTGERIVIPPHHKVSFIPEGNLKDQINKPFAAFEAIEAQEGDNGMIDLTVVEDSKIQEAEDSTIPQFHDSMIQELEDSTMHQEAGEEIAIPAIEEKSNELSHPQSEENQPPPFSTVIQIEEKPLKPGSQPAIENKPPPYSQRFTTQKKKKKKKTREASTKWLLIILFALIIVFIGIGIWYFLYSKSRGFDDTQLSGRMSGREAATVSVDSIPSTPIQEETLSTSDTLAISQPALSVEDTTQTTVPETPDESASIPVSTTSRQQTTSQTTASTPTTSTTQRTVTSTGNNVLARVSVEPGQRLTLIAEAYYGNKVFWVYIYEYNKAKIGPNPNLLKTGMEIQIPVKEVYGIDANSAASIDKATEIQRQIMEGLY